METKENREYPAKKAQKDRVENKLFSIFLELTLFNQLFIFREQKDRLDCRERWAKKVLLVPLEIEEHPDKWD